MVSFSIRTLRRIVHDFEQYSVYLFTVHGFFTRVVIGQAPVTQTVQKPVTTEVIATSAIQGIPAGAVIQGLPAGAVIRNGQIIIDQTTTTVPTTTVSNGVVVDVAATVPAGMSSLKRTLLLKPICTRSQWFATLDS